MRSLPRPIRAFALVQFLLALPLMGGSAVCIPLDGAGRAETRWCACASLPVAHAEPSIAADAADDCGPCRDVTLNSPRVQVRVDEAAPALLPHGAWSFFAAPRCAPAATAHVRFADPPARQLPVLRC